MGCHTTLLYDEPPPAPRLTLDTGCRQMWRRLAEQTQAHLCRRGQSVQACCGSLRESRNGSGWDTTKCRPPAARLHPEGHDMSLGDKQRKVLHVEFMMARPTVPMASGSLQRRKRPGRATRALSADWLAGWPWYKSHAEKQPCGQSQSKAHTKGGFKVLAPQNQPG